ncbi:hypothetical protein M6B38_192370 [Iris pallida]|uniref:Secreted protein n=1 Tax=Iris pallida TaxID=29817 RepID=A0AAX6EET8_IRIPA|nr:hypothetical protein M6B38_192370 [Iris pallida]
MRSRTMTATVEGILLRRCWQAAVPPYHWRQQQRSTTVSFLLRPWLMTTTGPAVVWRRSFITTGSGVYAILRQRATSIIGSQIRRW